MQPDTPVPVPLNQPPPGNGIPILQYDDVKALMAQHSRDEESSQPVAQTGQYSCLLPRSTRQIYFSSQPTTKTDFTAMGQHH